MLVGNSGSQFVIRIDLVSFRAHENKLNNSNGTSNAVAVAVNLISFSYNRVEFEKKLSN